MLVDFEISKDFFKIEENALADTSSLAEIFKLNKTAK